MEKYKVSIIVPVYNGKAFIEKCLNSLLNQTYKNLEIIVMNDGSSDDSQKIIDSYVKEYSYISSYYHENQGLSITRNRGIAYATGDYITVLDVDDWFDYDFIDKMMLQVTNEDLIIGGYRRVHEDGKIDFEYLIDESKWNKYKRVTVWAKLYKKDFLDNNKIDYPNEKLYGEDVVYTMRCLSCDPKVRFVHYIGYNNLINKQSITHQNKDKLLISVPLMINNIHNFIQNKKEYLFENEITVKYYYLKLFSNFLIEQSYFLSKEELNNYFKENIKSIKTIFDSYGYKFSFCKQKDESFSVNLFINLVVFFEKIKLQKVLVALLRMAYYGKETT